MLPHLSLQARIGRTQHTSQFAIAHSANSLGVSQLQLPFALQQVEHRLQVSNEQCRTAGFKESLLMAAKLRKGIDDVAQAAHNMGVEESRLTAMLWAMQASGLLMRESIAASATPDANRKRHASPPPGLIRRLALRFGFSGVTHA